MHIDDSNIPDLDLPDVELVFDELPSLEEVLRASPSVAVSPPLTKSRTLFSERICIRINRSVLDSIKHQASRYGMPYQTYINLLLAKSTTH